MPSKEYVIKYFQELRNSDYPKFLKLTQIQKTANEIGDEKSFNVLNLENPDKPKFENKLFVLKKMDDLINIWVEKAELTNSHVSIYNISALLDPERVD